MALLMWLEVGAVAGGVGDFCPHEDLLWRGGRRGVLALERV